ncbi:MAG TPA: hypothetical protein VF276_08450, partial [Chloroflexia bacterium]
MEDAARVRIDDLARQFASPPREYSPAPIWWWSGERLERDRLRRQLEQLAAGGIYNVVLLNLAPTGPLFGSVADDPPFLSEEWWAIFLGVCADARELGVRILFYDQIGFSGANLQGVLARANPQFTGHWLACATVEGEGSLELATPGEGTALGAVVTDLASGKREVVPLTERGVTYTAPAPSRLRLVYAVPRGFDYFNPAACQALFDTVHYEFERRAGQFFGTVIAGSFQDELPSMPTWGPDFAAAFRERCGYDLAENLGALWEGEDDWARRVRADYQATRAALAERAFFKPLFDWHARHSLICGFDQTHPARAGDPQGAVGLYADYMRTHRWYTAPGSDHHGEAKIHSSLAHLYDRPRTWIESFHSSGWGGTLEETFDWLLPWLRAGANLYNPHAVYYSTRGGWWEWAPPSTCWRQPYWRHYRQFAGAVNRLCYMLTRGHHVCDIGILYPTTTVQSAYTPDGPLPSAQPAHLAYIDLVGHMTWYHTVPGVFDRDRRDFDVLDDASIQRAQIADGALVIGAERYSVVVLPTCTVLEPATAAALCRFVEAGGRLIAVGALPEAVAGPDPAPVGALRGLFNAGRATLVPRPDDVPAALADLPRQVDAPVPVLHRRIGNSDLVFVPAAFPRATQEPANKHWANFHYTFDPADYQRRMRVRVRGVSGAPQLWDAATGQRRALAATPVADGVEVEIPFDDGPAALLVWADPAAPAEQVSGVNAAGSEETLATLDDWQSAIVPTLDNRYGDLALPAAPGAPPVQTWRFAHRIERPGEDSQAADPTDAGDWQPVEATFGPYGWWTGPLPADRLPPPLADRADGQPLAPTDWHPAVYSRSRGIARDPIHYSTLGPKARVPQEFLLFGPTAPGEGVRFRTSVASPAEQRAYLALGGPGAKRAWLNGEPCGTAPAGYLWLAPVTLRQGRNVLEWELVAEARVNLRASWALVRDPARYARPEWLTSAGAPVRDSRLRFSTTLDLPFAPVEGTIQIGTADPCRVIVNGVEVGRQGGFDPYLVGRVQPYTTDAWRQGANSVVLEVLDPGRPVALVADALIHSADGETAGLMTGADWWVQRDDGPAQPATLRRRQWIDQPAIDASEGFGEMDVAFANLWRRPHPLPDADWLEDTPHDDTVLPLVPDAFGSRRVEWFRWQIPPGATAIHLPVDGEVRLWVDGAEVEVSEDTVKQARLGGAPAASRQVVMRVVPASNLSGGAVFAGPVTYEMGVGRIRPGEWAAQGLEAYSGGVRYSTAFALVAPPTGRLMLDLGRVRGTAEVTVNGQSCGVRVWSPYRFDITAAAQVGQNTVEVLVCNTLAPYLRAVSPTHYVFPG